KNGAYRESDDLGGWFGHADISYSITDTRSENDRYVGNMVATVDRKNDRNRSRTRWSRWRGRRKRRYKRKGYRFDGGEKIAKLLAASRGTRLYDPQDGYRFSRRRYKRTFRAKGRRHSQAHGLHSR